MDREVTATAKKNGQVTALFGDWGRVTVGIAVREIDNGRHRYYVAGPAFLETYLLPSGVASVQVPDEPNALLSLPDAG